MKRADKPSTERPYHPGLEDRDVAADAMDMGRPSGSPVARMGLAPGGPGLRSSGADIASTLGSPPTSDRVGVMQVVTRLNVGGPGRAVLALQDALPERGFEPTLVHGSVAATEGELAGRGRVVAVPALVREIDPVHDVLAYGRIAHLVRRLRPALVHTHMAKAGALGRLAASGAGAAVVHTFHGHVLQGYFGAMRNATFASLERRLARRTDALIAVAEQVRDDLLELGVGVPERWHVVPIGIDAQAMHPIDRTIARRRLGLPASGPIVGCVGRLVPIKDHETFLRAARVVAAEREDVTFAIAGDGELRERLERRAMDLVGPRAVFLGWVDDLPTLYGALDVVALTSRLEGTPLSLIEAGAAGRPAVATRVGGVADVVRDDETGYLVDPMDAPAVARRLLELLEEPRRAGSMGASARRHIRRRFSTEAMVDGVAQIYRDVLARRASRVPAAGDDLRHRPSSGRRPRPSSRGRRRVGRRQEPPQARQPEARNDSPCDEHGRDRGTVDGEPGDRADRLHERRAHDDPDGGQAA
jgi:glycosyltransferase involved in cell wall biosynthesis